LLLNPEKKRKENSTLSSIRILKKKREGRIEKRGKIQ